ncbi:MAG: hypothetical protein KZQ94_15925 [Candidatus Thiodiazotropha sp. (ex Troendleina suluensis)]|nr:hypothetical protein [Candidatus Thiodiazotropha sp. (ex Troendleina suluensis)]
MALGLALGALASSLYASNRASNASEDAASTAAGLTQDQYQQSRSDLAPYRETGNEALARLADTLGLSTPQLDRQRVFNQEDYQRAYTQYNVAQGHPDFSSKQLLFSDPWRHYNEKGLRFADAASRYGVNLDEAAFGPAPVEQAAVDTPAEPDLSQFFASPGYEFNLNEVLSANEGRAASRGRLNSSATDRSNARYASGLASNEYSNYLNQLNSLAGVGQTANTNLASLGANAANNSGNALQNAGTARASGYLGQANTINNSLNSYLNSSAYTNLGNQLYGNSVPTVPSRADFYSTSSYNL